MPPPLSPDPGCVDLTLVEALGSPPLSSLLPFARSPSWHAARLSLQERLAEFRARFRSPSALWGALHGGTPPPGATWASLCRPGTWHRLIALLRSPSPAPLLSRVVSWKCRWLVDPDADANRAKRALIRGWLEHGRIVVLQETHWSDLDEKVWASLLPACKVYASNARPGRLGGPQGGVAVLVPDRYSVSECRVLAPGLAVAVRICGSDDDGWLVGAYFPPGCQMEAATELRQALAGLQPVTFFAADVNLCVDEPRHGEEPAVNALLGLLQAAQLRPILIDGPTCRPRRRPPAAGPPRARPRRPPQLPQTSTRSTAWRRPRPGRGDGTSG